MKGFIVLNYLSILNLRIMLDVPKAHGLHTQKLIRIYHSKRGDPSDHARNNEKKKQQKEPMPSAN